MEDGVLLDAGCDGSRRFVVLWVEVPVDVGFEGEFGIDFFSVAVVIDGDVGLDAALFLALEATGFGLALAFGLCLFAAAAVADAAGKVLGFGMIAVVDVSVAPLSVADFPERGLALHPWPCGCAPALTAVGAVSRTGRLMLLLHATSRIRV